MKLIKVLCAFFCRIFWFFFSFKLAIEFYVFLYIEKNRLELHDNTHVFFHFYFVLSAFLIIILVWKGLLHFCSLFLVILKSDLIKSFVLLKDLLAILLIDLIKLKSIENVPKLNFTSGCWVTQWFCWSQSKRDLFWLWINSLYLSHSTGNAFNSPFFWLHSLKR